ncbi:hypothetical protein BDV96DRAFT_616290 [Lophiotrema nucula]|uniref:NADH:flavin oxidoreductase/NADH oxidase N-terminal domain-containing protein n=1 Tax=Lophiotrema nucula TaxID=690887 RepID=A0A6A5YMH4_9PLEO|nr:hypothetical protein BDV96DRAFT_616290 [Lophiotrema nucula]
MAPMTRNRGVPVPNQDRMWMTDDVVALYYSQRASPGGLIITEGIPPSLKAAGMPNVAGIFHETQITGWRKVMGSVHAKGGVIYAQLWHAGRTTIPQFTGCPVVSASSVPWETEDAYPFRTPDTKEKIRYRDFPSVEMTRDQIAQTTRDFVKAAERAIAVGFDGVELNAGNGNLIDQFLHSNLNLRSDEYGGSPEARCKFPLDLLDAVASATGPSNVAIRLEPACSYQGTYGMERVETWSYLCSQIASKYSGSSEKLSYKVGIPCISCGGWDESNVSDGVKQGWDGIAFARWFVSNQDLVERLRTGAKLQDFDRSRFYGSWDGERGHGYTDYPKAGETGDFEMDASGKIVYE